MEYEIFNIFKNYTLEVILIALGAFLLTYLIKIPIKKKTNNLDESKRKMINIVIMFIPLILSLLTSIIYYGITKKEWFSLLVVDSSLSAWLLSLSMYAIVSRIWLVIKGIMSGKLQINPELTKETVTYIQNTIKALNTENKTTEKSLTSISGKLNSLIALRNIMANDTISIDLTKIAELNNEISILQTTETECKEKIQTNTERIKAYTEKLYNKSNN